MSYKKTITKRKRETLFRKNLFAAFDFETTGLDGEVVFGSLQFELSIDGERSAIHKTYSAAGMLDLMIENNQPKMRWYAHNLEFDLYFILHEAQSRLDTGEIEKIDLCERGMGKFYKAVFHLSEGGKLELIDSMAVFGFSLKIFLKQFSTVGDKLELDFESEQFDIHNPHHIDYALQDTRGLLDAMINFDRAVYQIFGVHLKGTISSTALAAWEVTLKEDDVFFRLSAPQEEFCRNAYFGGLVFLTSNGQHDDIVSLDVNSMYPHCMRAFGVPVGVPSLTRKLQFERPSIYRAIFSAPDNLDFGCIGFRDKKGVAWARGEFESYAFGFEIERALKWGYKIKILEGLMFDDYAFPFSDFVDNCETKRAEYKGQAFEIVVKLIQNSVYGKFGTKTEGGEVAIYPDDYEPDADWYPYVNPNTGAMQMPGLYKKDVERDTYYMLPHWAACITARARGELLDIVELGGGAVIYGDTDSAKMPRSVFEQLKNDGLINIGNRYGELKLDAEYSHFKAIAPKVYAYVSRETYSGRGKGIPEKQRTSQFWQDVFNGGAPTVEFKSLQSLQTALKNGGNRKLKTATRTSTKLANSVGWLDNNGKIKSIKITNGEREK